MQSKTLTNKGFYKSSGFFAITSVVASLANYALYPILSKIISPSELGDVGVILAIIVQTGSLLLAFNLVSIYLVSRESESVAIKKLEMIQKGLVRLSVLISIVIIMFLPPLKQLLRIEGYSPLIGLACLLIVVIPSVIWTGYLQGRKALPLIGIFNLVNAFTKVAGATVMALLGFGVGGVIFGVVLGFIVSLIVLKYLSPYRLPSITSTIRKSSHVLSLTDIKFYILEALVVAGLMAALYSLDIVSAKILFTRDYAGVYVGASTIAGSTTYYIIMTLMWIILPHYSATSMKHNRKLLIKAVAVSAVIAASLGGLFSIFGEQIIRVALGSDYLVIKDILWKVCLSQALIAATTMVAFSSIVLRWSGALRLSISVLSASVVAILLSSRTYHGLVNAMLLGGGIGWSLFIASTWLKTAWSSYEKN
jgi:O-antigen/teichoic acid export membrane protein